MSEQGLYQKVGQLLLDAGPSEAQKIVVRARLFAEGDGGSYEFDYFDKTNRSSWFDPDSRVVGDLTELLVELRRYYVENGLCQNGKAWSSCAVTLDVEGMKISIDYNYDDKVLFAD
ncbi:immunity protein YezG family protein [Pseudomonas sp. FW300-N2F2]|uniref:immunity protein YezG family protein n=1 Tax=Pseudomonas sp. FW300-N2F2 TaxID=2751320 RepID=UPI001A91C298|nr:hypothetical protein [Pseudomonas sp. FW300-N2F2]